MCLTELELPNQHAQYFLPRTLRQSLSCVPIPFPCVLPGSRVEFCQWCALVRCSPFCLTFLFAPFAPKHHRTSHHGISTHLLHFGVTGFLLSPSNALLHDILRLNLAASDIYSGLDILTKRRNSVSDVKGIFATVLLTTTQGSNRLWVASRSATLTSATSCSNRGFRPTKNRATPTGSLFGWS